MKNNDKSPGLTIVELLVATVIAIIAIGGAFALWSMTQDSWVNERKKSTVLQELQITIERIKREVQLSDSLKIFYHTKDDGTYDAISLPMALDDGKGNTGYNSLLDNDGFLEPDSSTYDPITGVSKIYWDKTVIYHLYPENGVDDDDFKQLRRTTFSRDKSLTSAELQNQIDKVVELGTGDNAAVPSYANWENTRTIFKAEDVALEIVPQLLEFDGYSPQTERTESLIDFGSTVLTGDYHTIKFKVTKKNPASSDYGFGVDLLKFTPPGSIIEAENHITLTNPDGSSGISGSSGDSATAVNTHTLPSGVWSNNYYLNYAADSIGDYLTLRFYYDRWYETTFLDGIPRNVVVEFSNRTGVQGEALGNEEYTVRLEGYEETWSAIEQLQEQTPEPIATQSTTLALNTVYKNFIQSDYLKWNGRKLRIKFTAGNDVNGLYIGSAYIIPEDGSGPSINITFSGSAFVTIAQNDSAWSDWIQLTDNEAPPNAMSFDKTKSYYVGFTATNPLALSSAMWGTDATAGVNSYIGPLETEDKHIYAVSAIEVTYIESGNFSSKIFDTAIETPDYDTMTWISTNNSPDANLQISIRSAANKADLEADGDWLTIPGQVFASSPAGLGALGNNRYVQFRANFTASPGGGTAEDYDKSSVLKDISIYWPGNTTMVDIAGYFTKKPDYGIFTIEIDGQKLIKGFEIKLSITEELTTGSEVTRSINAEVEPRNTNK